MHDPTKQMKESIDGLRSDQLASWSSNRDGPLTEVSLEDLGDQGSVGESHGLERLGVLHCQLSRRQSAIELTGVGTSAPVTRSGAASRKSNAGDSQI